MAQRILIGDKTGVLLGEIEADLGPITWTLNDASNIKFKLSKKDAKASEILLRYGNRICIEFSNGLPNWGGMIDPPRTWDDSTIEVTAFSPEYILATRLTDRGRYYTNASIGEIFKTTINEANTLAPTGITPGTIYNGGTLHSPEYHFETALDIIRDSICTRLSQAEYEITASSSGGQITFTANLYERRGSDKPNVVLMEGHNLSEPLRLIEQGKIVNDWSVAGAGSNWGDDRIYSYRNNPTSWGYYGLRQATRIFNDVTVQQTLDANTDNLLEESKDPHNMVEVTAISLAPALFSDYDLGDSIRVILYSYGFGGFDRMVKIVGREFDPKTGTCTLAVREA